MSEKRFVLASSSPRRKALLHKILDDFVIVSPTAEEKETGVPVDVAETNALLKGRAVNAPFAIACDTIVVLGDKIYGKPLTRDVAFRDIRELSGKTHLVISGLYVRANGEETVTHETSYVTIKKLTDEEIYEYIDKYNPLDKAGAYGLQDGVVVEKFEGSEDNIVGLPTEKLREILRKYVNVKEELYD